MLLFQAIDLDIKQLPTCILFIYLFYFKVLDKVYFQFMPLNESLRFSLLQSYCGEAKCETKKKLAEVCTQLAET